MLLQPKTAKFKNTQKGKIKKTPPKTLFLHLGNVGLKSKENGVITAKQLNAAKQSITQKLKKSAKIWVKIFPNLALTKKPKETRMGKGKGMFAQWAKKIVKGATIFEVRCSDNNNAISALKSGSAKLPIKTLVFKQSV